MTNTDAERVSDIVARLRDVRDRAQHTINTGGRDDFDPREVPFVADDAIAIIEAQSKALAEARTVKPLEWHKHERDDLERYNAEPPFASYIITWTASGYELYIGFWGSAAEPHPAPFAALAAAKAAAQADYQQRILSALVTPTPENPNG